MWGKKLPYVQKGQAITQALWNDLVALVAGNRIYPGDGVLVRRVDGVGTFLAAAGGGGSFEHPFRVSLHGSIAKITPGLVNGLEPRIGSVPLSGDARNGRPELTIAPLKVDDAGHGYVAIEMQCDAQWKLLKDKLTMVQVAYYDTVDGKKTLAGAGGPSALGGIPGLPGRKVRYPIARLVNRRGRIEVLQIAHFNLNHRASPRPEAKDVARHFFWNGGAG